MNEDQCYKATLARDYRFDGKFFVGVRTTGIYCRPICPAKPKRENVTFYPTSLAAERAGYRPCLRCRPESAPLSPNWYGTSAIVQRALRLIARGEGFDENEDRFASQFGVTARHLRRLFAAEVGQSPQQIARGHRLNFARKLVTESNLPLADVADTAAFSSVRRFNDAFKKRFHQPPSALRRRGDAAAGRRGAAAGMVAGAVELTLAYRPPYDWDSLLDFHRGHFTAGVEAVTETGYERVFGVSEFRAGRAGGGDVGWLRVTPEETGRGLRLSVVVEDATALFGVAQRVRHMFDLDSDPLLVANSFEGDVALGRLWRKYPGLRLARGWDPFETAIRTILGQLVSVRRGSDLTAQLVGAYGRRVAHPVTGAEARLFPAANVLAGASLEEVGTTTARKNTIRELARRVAVGELDLMTPRDGDEMREELLSIPGIGPWSAEYIRLRALGDTDAFPGSDLILQRATDLHPELDLEAVRPWRSYAAIYLWRHYAASLTRVRVRKPASVTEMIP